MTTLQNNFTTPEQSKRLLELGLPMDSADCVHTLKTNRVFFMQNGKVTDGYLSLYKAARGEEAEPCWSVGRLIEISTIMNNGVIYIKNDFEGSLIDVLINYLGSSYSNFSKLEE